MGLQVLVARRSMHTISCHDTCDGFACFFPHGTHRNREKKQSTGGIEQTACWVGTLTLGSVGDDHADKSPVQGLRNYVDELNQTDHIPGASPLIYVVRTW